MTPTLLVALVLAMAFGADAPAARPMRIGHSEQGRPISVVRVGNPHGTRVLVFGSIHGNEPGGIPIAQALERVHTSADLWIVTNLNPDGRAHDTRQDARGVDLNSNWPSQWQGGGRPFDVYYGGPKPFSESETRVARNLILRIRPRVTIWYHQHMNVIWAFGPSTRAGRIYARASGEPLYHHPWRPGTAANWQNHALPDTSSFTVELPGGTLSAAQVHRHVAAVLKLAHG